MNEGRMETLGLYDPESKYYSYDIISNKSPITVASNTISFGEDPYLLIAVAVRGTKLEDLGDGMLGRYLEFLKSIQSLNNSKVKISSIKGSKKAVKIGWKAKKNVSGYQIQYSRRIGFSGSKIVAVKKASTISKKITGLERNKKYYVRVRAYKTIFGHTY